MDCTDFSGVILKYSALLIEPRYFGNAFPRTEFDLEFLFSGLRAPVVLTSSIVQGSCPTNKLPIRPTTPGSEKWVKTFKESNKLKNSKSVQKNLLKLAKTRKRRNRGRSQYFHLHCKFGSKKHYFEAQLGERMSTGWTFAAYRIPQFVPPTVNRGPASASEQVCK
ncbi:unnamed protein product, partial [Nesidiocoris tenuis]